MTSQQPNLFEYRGEEYCLMGFTGGILPEAEDFGMQFGSGCSTANYRGHVMIYGVDDANQFVIKRIEPFCDETTPITHHYPQVQGEYGREFYELNEPISFTGHLLFSDGWTVHYLYRGTFAPDLDVYPLFEVAVEAGIVTEIRDCANEVYHKLKGHDPHELYKWFVEDDAEGLKQAEIAWNMTADFLPRRYDALYTHVWYFSFPEYIAEMSQRLSDTT